MNVLEVKNLRKRVGDTEVLKGIDLTLKKGEVLAVIYGNDKEKMTAAAEKVLRAYEISSEIIEKQPVVREYIFE